MPPPPTPAPVHPPVQPIRPNLAPVVPPPVAIDFDATITAIEQAMPGQLFALELLREVGHLLSPTPPA